MAIETRTFPITANSIIFKSGAYYRTDENYRASATYVSFTQFDMAAIADAFNTITTLEKVEFATTAGSFYGAGLGIGAYNGTVLESGAPPAYVSGNLSLTTISGDVVLDITDWALTTTEKYADIFTNYNYLVFYSTNAYTQSVGAMTTTPTTIRITGDWTPPVVDPYDFNTLKFDVTLNTGFFETSAYTEDTQMFVTSGNHDGAGCSIGNLQYNFGSSDHAQEVFSYMVTNYPTIVANAFGANTTEHDTFVNVINTYTRAQRVTWADSISIPDADPNLDKRILYEPYKSAFGNILISPECKARYYWVRDTYYWDLPYDLFRQMPCVSKAALASFFDLYINKGRYYPINLIQWDFEQIDANNALTADEKEAQKIIAINDRGNSEENSLNDASSAAFAPRRNCMRNQGGTYYGAAYDPETQFSIDQSPALAEKVATGESTGVKLGELAIQNMYLGTIPIQNLYLGATLLGGGAIAGYTTNKVPDTQFRTNPNSYAGFESGSINMTSGQPLWIDVQNFVASRTYYTTDGSTPTTASPRYTGALTFASSCTLNALTVSIFGVAEAVKTLTITVATAPTTTISPSATVQNTIPFTVSLSTDEVGATIYYILGTGTQQTYTAPFSVNQSSAGVQSTNITVKYWAVGASATETQKTITYDTLGAIPVAPVVTATGGTNKVDLSWGATANTTSYTIYRSTVSGNAGTILTGTQYMTGTSWSDTTAVGGTTYYYTVQAGNYGTATNSAQVLALPDEAGNNYSTDFSTQTVGSAPTGWTSRWVTGSETMTIISDATAISGKAMRYVTTVDNNRRFWSWNNVPIYTGDWDMLVKWKISGLGTTGDIPIRAMAEVSGGTTAQYGYAGDVLTTSATMRIQDYTNSTVSTKGSGTGLSVSANTWYWYRFNRTGNTLSLRMWEDGSAEPTSWNVIATDTTPLTTMVGLV